MCEIVLVLHTTIGAIRRPSSTCFAGDVAQPDVTHQALPLQVRQHCERRFERPLNRMMRVEHAAKVDDVEHIDAEIAKIVVDGLRQVLAGRGPAAMSHPCRALAPILVTMTRSSG